MNCNPCGQPIGDEAYVTVTFDGTPSLRGITVIAHARCIRLEPTRCCSKREACHSEQGCPDPNHPQYHVNHEFGTLAPTVEVQV